jgi:hypothetical protein
MERHALEQLLALLPTAPDDDTLVSAVTLRKSSGAFAT